MSETVHNVTELPKPRRLSRKFIITVAVATAAAVVAVAVKKNLSSNEEPETVNVETASA